MSRIFQPSMHAPVSPRVTFLEVDVGAAAYVAGSGP
jgi:hypothetical protein